MGKKKIIRKKCKIQCTAYTYFCVCTDKTFQCAPVKCALCWVWGHIRTLCGALMAHLIWETKACRMLIGHECTRLTGKVLIKFNSFTRPRLCVLREYCWWNRRLAELSLNFICMSTQTCLASFLCKYVIGKAAFVIYLQARDQTYCPRERRTRCSRVGSGSRED